MKDELKSFEWAELNSMTDKCVIVVLMMRPGARHFIVKLEYDHYTPRSDRNELFQQALGAWQGMMFCAIVIPKEERHLAEQVAASIGMVLAEDHVMVMFAGEGPQEFPAKGPHIFHLEGTYKDKDKGESYEEGAVHAIFEADLPLRRDWVMHHLRIGRAYTTFLDSWLNSMQNYCTLTPLFIQRCVETRPEAVEVLVSEYEGQVYGWITICRKDGGQPYIGALWTSMEERRLGIATSLVMAALAFCVQKDLGRLKIESRSTYLDKIISHFPAGAEEVVEVHHLGDDLSVEQRKEDPYAQFPDEPVQRSSNSG